MAGIKIATVTTKTNGGYTATIKEIDITDTDCLHGSFRVKIGGKVHKARWNLSGICRDNDNDANIPPKHIRDLIATAKRLGCK